MRFGRSGLDEWGMVVLHLAVASSMNKKEDNDERVMAPSADFLLMVLAVSELEEVKERLQRALRNKRTCAEGTDDIVIWIAKISEHIVERREAGLCGPLPPPD